MEWEYPWKIKESIRVDFFSRTLGNVSTLFHHGWEASMSIKYTYLKSRALRRTLHIGGLDFGKLNSSESVGSEGKLLKLSLDDERPHTVV